MYRHRNIPWIENIFKIIKTLVFQMRLFEGSLEYSHHAIKKVTPNWASGLLSHDDPGLMSLPSDEVARIAGLPRADVQMWPTPNCGRKSQQNQNKQLAQTTQQYPAFQHVRLPKTWDTPKSHGWSSRCHFGGFSCHLHLLGTGLQELGHRCARGISVELLTIRC